MMCLGLFGIISASLVVFAHGKPTNQTLHPADVELCFDLVYKCHNNEVPHEMCSRLKNGDGKYIIAPNDVDYFKDLLMELVHDNNRRAKRSAYVQLKVRKEVRVLSAAQWKRFVAAINALKRKGIYDRIAIIHQGFVRLSQAHNGPAFLPWHRVFLLVLEHALAKYTKYYGGIPYWDQTLDFDLADPTDSELFTYKYFGSSKGRVGAPFNWKTSSNEYLVRNIGATGSLISKEAVKRVLSRKYHSEITDDKKPYYFLEGYHDGTHLWVDGQMSIIDQTAEDPIFWLHHAYIDKLWQRFRDQQMNKGINPINDYPKVRGLHNANEPMNPFKVTNRNGYSEYWIDNFYRYEPSPKECSVYKDQYQGPYQGPYPRLGCGTDNLVCDKKLGRCVAKGGETGTRPTVLPTLRFAPRFSFDKRFVDSRTSGIQVPLKKKYGRRPRPQGKPAVSLSDLLAFINQQGPSRKWKRSVSSEGFDAAQRMCLEVKKHA